MMTQRELEQRVRANEDLHDVYLSRATLAGVDLRHASLSRADLSDADLHGADLHHADLSGADLHSANLASTDLSRADLYDADLRRADLRNANLCRANLRRADLTGADLTGANLTDADMSYANLADTILTGTIGQTPADAMTRVVNAVRGVSAGGCWCGFGIGHPLMSSHSAACAELSAAIAAATMSDTTLEAAVLRAVQAAYRLGASDAQRLCATEALIAAYKELSSGEGPGFEEPNALAKDAANRVLEAVRCFDPVRAMPNWTALVRSVLGGEP